MSDAVYLGLSMLETRLLDRDQYRSLRHCYCLACVALQLPQIGYGVTHF